MADFELFTDNNGEAIIVNLDNVVTITADSRGDENACWITTRNGNNIKLKGSVTDLAEIVLPEEEG